MCPGFLHLEDIQPIPGLESLIVDGVSTMNLDVILSEMHSFYSDLYSNWDCVSDTEIKEFLNSIPSLPKVLEGTDDLISVISSDEVEAAIKQLWTGKAPGSNGLTADFYKHFLVELAPILAKVFNDIFENKKLSAAQCLAIIILLFKKGDKQLLNNYRLISLTNTDYKVLAYILSNRLEKHLMVIISSQQTAYMKGQFIGTNIRSIQDFIDHTIVEGADHIVLFLDYKKAFDSISHHFLFALLDHIGLPHQFVEWVKIIYTDACSVLRHKNWLAPKLSLQRGVQQGCPLSCHLFNLVGQVVLFSLRDVGLFDWWKKPGDLDSQYEDDIALLLENTNALPSVIKHIQFVGRLIGLTLNLDKTIAFSPKAIGFHMIHGIQMSNSPVRYLGAFLGIGDLSSLNFEKPLRIARQKIHAWNSRNLTLPARVTVAKTFIFSLFTHILNVVYVRTIRVTPEDLE